MIDTDKYEGHAKEGWHFDSAHVLRDGYDKEIAGLVGEDWLDDEATQKLIVDAPLLLAEIKRLDAIIRDIESLIPENPDYVCEQILGACHRYMYPEEFGEVIE
jgi:hypothetical protein